MAYTCIHSYLRQRSSNWRPMQAKSQWVPQIPKESMVVHICKPSCEGRTCRRILVQGWPGQKHETKSRKELKQKKKKGLGCSSSVQGPQFSNLVCPKTIMIIIKLETFCCIFLQNVTFGKERILINKWGIDKM
jgi:hypothetical protein